MTYEETKAAAIKYADKWCTDVAVVAHTDGTFGYDSRRSMLDRDCENIVGIALPDGRYFVPQEQQK